MLKKLCSKLQMNWFKHVFYEETPIQYETIILVIALILEMCCTEYET